MGIFEKLGLGWQDILFHAINFIILVVALYFLLFKSVKKLIKNHKAKLDDVFKENQKLNAEAADAKRKNDEILANVRKEAMDTVAEATLKAERKSDELISEAKQKAENIVETAKKEAVAEKLRLKNDLKESAGKLAVDIAEKVLQREVSAADNKKIIDECLNKWDKA